MASDQTTFLLVLAALFCIWAQSKGILYTMLKVVIVVAAVICLANWVTEIDNHKKTRTNLEIMEERIERERRLRKEKDRECEEKIKELKNKLTENERLEMDLKRQNKELKELKNKLTENERLEMDLKRQNKELKKMETLTRAYQKFRQWIEDDASNSYSRVCFTEFKPSEVDGVIKNPKKPLGTGAYGSVYEVVIRDKTVAMKILKNSKNGIREFNQEVEILKKTRHENLVTLIGACSDKAVLFYELLPNGTLEGRLTEENRGSFTWKERVRVTDSICCALVFLHCTSPPIAHGDLKPSNILFDAKNVCKLGDFGISRLLPKTTDTDTPYHSTEEPKGTGPYKDPEFHDTGKLTPQSDVFALGIILLQLVTGKGAMGLRKHVLENMATMKLEKRDNSQKRKILKKCLLDAKLEWDDESIDDALKMVYLGIECSEDGRKKRPSLETEVWPEIVSMNSQNAAMGKPPSR